MKANKGNEDGRYVPFIAYEIGNLIREASNFEKFRADKSYNEQVESSRPYLAIKGYIYDLLVATYTEAEWLISNNPNSASVYKTDLVYVLRCLKECEWYLSALSENLNTNSYIWFCGNVQDLAQWLDQIEDHLVRWTDERARIIQEIKISGESK